MFVVDTNLLIYAADEDFSGQKRMRDLLAEWGASPEAWYTTWSVLYEFLRVTTHRSVFSHPLLFSEAWNFVEQLHSSPSFGILIETDRHAQVVRDLRREYPRMSGNRLHDLHIAAVMREHGVVEIRTADTGFHEFKFLRVVNPL
jgi:toxin-antitoxin system PIN domain toxin